MGRKCEPRVLRVLHVPWAFLGPAEGSRIRALHSPTVSFLSLEGRHMWNRSSHTDPGNLWLDPLHSFGLLGAGLILFPTTGPFLQWSHLISRLVLLSLSLPGPHCVLNEHSHPSSFTGKLVLTGHTQSQKQRRPNYCPVWEGKCLLFRQGPSL